MIIGVDFDGVLCDPNTCAVEQGDLLSFGAPIPGAVEFLKECLAYGHSVIVFTCRSSQEPSHAWPPVSPNAVEDSILTWLTFAGLTEAEKLKVRVCPPRWGKPACDLYLDDKAVRFEGLFPSMMTLENLRRPWWKT